MDPTVLDPRSIVVVITTLTLLMAIVLSAMPSGGRNRQPGLRQWSIGMLCVAIASAFYALRDIAPDVLSVTLANALALGATALIYRGGRAFFDLPRQTGPLLLIWLLANLGLLYCLYVEDLYAMRVLIFSCVSAALLFGFARDVWRYRPRQASGRARFPYLFTASTVTLDALVSFARVVNVALSPPAGDGFLAPTLINTLYFSSHGLMAVCISVGFILMLGERLHAKLERQLSHDPLTDAYSRPMIFELAEQELQSDRPLALLLLDIDHFKQVNDSLGHQGGDRVLRHFVQCLASHLRVDEPLGRYGGEEFVILLRNADAESAQSTAERLRQCVAAHPYRHADGELAITTSIGVATAYDLENLEQLLQRADTALYRAKRAGRNRVEHA